MRKLICFFLVGFLAVSFAVDIRQRHSGCSKADLSTRHACSVDDEGTLYVGYYSCFDNVDTDYEWAAELGLVGYGVALQLYALNLQLEFGRFYAPAICVVFDFDDDVQYRYYESAGKKAWLRIIQHQNVYLESAQFKSEVSSRLKACQGWDTSRALTDLNSL